MGSTVTHPRLRVRYSTLINYASFLYRLVVSIGFSTIVIRRLSVEEYGLFTTLFAIYGLFTPFISFWMMWTYRNYARLGVNRVVITGYTLTHIYSIISAILIVGATLSLPFIGVAEKYNLQIVLLMTGLTGFFSILYASYSSIILAYRPYVLGYSSIFMDTIRFFSALIFVYYYRLELLGALIAVLLANIAAYSILIYYLITNKVPRIGFGIYIDALKLFIKNSYIPLTGIITRQIRGSGEKLITGLVSLSPVYPAYLGIAGITRRFISGGGISLVRSLSPSLLRRPNRRDVEDVLRITFIILIYMIGVLVVFAKPIISLFNIVYLNAIPLFVLYSFVPLMEIMMNVFAVIGSSSDRTDLVKSGLSLRKSIMFKNGLTILIITASKFIVGAILFLLLYTYTYVEDPNILIVFPISSIVFYIVGIYILYKRSKRFINYNIPFREAIVSLIGILSIFVVAVLTGLNNYIIRRISIDYPIIIAIIVLSLSIYIPIVYTLSPWTRKFIRKGVSKILQRWVVSGEEIEG